MRFHYKETYPLQSPQGRAIAAIILLVGLLICAISIFRIWQYHQIRDELIPVQGVIERIDTQRTRRNTTHTVYVSYTYQERAYENVKLGWYRTGMDAGDSITLEIHPENPGEVVGNTGLSLLFFGGVFTLVGAGLSVAARRGQLNGQFHVNTNL